MHLYAIGDIHGHLALLQAAHDLIADDMARHGPGQIIHVGDLVDRGPDSRGVIDFLMQGQAQGQARRRSQAWRGRRAMGRR